jgi:hypothetical protein
MHKGGSDPIRRQTDSKLFALFLPNPLGDLIGAVLMQD